MRRASFLCGSIGMLGIAGLATARPASAAIDEEAIGRQVFAKLREDGDLLFDSPYYEHLNEVGAAISNTVKDRYPYPVEFHVVKGDNANAFSVPGGRIYVNEPLLRMAKNRDELAGVLAHETGHMVLHHVAKRMQSQKTLGTIGSVLSIPIQILLGPLGSLPAGYALDALANAQDSNISRHIEAQADEEGARIVAATGEYNPYGMIWFFKEMTKTYGDKGAYWLRSHPFDSARVADLKDLFASQPAVFSKFDATDRSEEAYW